MSTRGQGPDRGASHFFGERSLEDGRPEASRVSRNEQAGCRSLDPEAATPRREHHSFKRVASGSSFGDPGPHGEGDLGARGEAVSPRVGPGRLALPMASDWHVPLEIKGRPEQAAWIRTARASSEPPSGLPKSCRRRHALSPKTCMAMWCVFGGHLRWQTT